MIHLEELEEYIYDYVCMPNSYHKELYLSFCDSVQSIELDIHDYLGGIRNGG